MISALLVAVALALLVCAYYWYPRPDNAKAKSRRRGPKKVRFSPEVQVIGPRPGVRKSDRYNPDLRDCVKRNTRQAMAVGGAKVLASIDLHQVG